MPSIWNTAPIAGPRRLRGPLLAVGAAIAVLLVAACGGGSEPDRGAGAAEPGGTGAPAGFGGAHEFGMSEQQLVEAIDAVEARIARCMTAAGFEYVRVDASTVRDAMDALGSSPGLSDEDFVAQFGYGISTQFDDPGAATVFGEQNVRLLQQLAPADRTAYVRTLLGEDGRATFVLTLDDEDFAETGGCTAQAIEQSFDAEQLDASYTNPFDVLVDQDPRMVAARGEWAACMSEEGFDYERQEDAEDEIAERLDAIVGDGEPSALTGSALAALTALQGEERAIAQADLDCAEEFLDDVEEEVESELAGRRS